MRLPNAVHKVGVESLKGGAGSLLQLFTMGLQEGRIGSLLPHVAILRPRATHEQRQPLASLFYFFIYQLNLVPGRQRVVPRLWRRRDLTSSLALLLCFLRNNQVCKVLPLLRSQPIVGTIKVIVQQTKVVFRLLSQVLQIRRVLVHFNPDRRWQAD